MVGCVCCACETAWDVSFVGLGWKWMRLTWCRYVWGKDVAQAKTLCESLDYIFQLAVEMHKLGIPWIKE